MKKNKYKKHVFKYILRQLSKDISCLQKKKKKKHVEENIRI